MIGIKPSFFDINRIKTRILGIIPIHFQEFALPILVIAYPHSESLRTGRCQPFYRWWDENEIFPPLLFTSSKLVILSMEVLPF